MFLHAHHTHTDHVLTGDLAVVFTPEEIERFKTDSEFFWKARRTMDASLNVSSRLTSS